MTGPMYTAVAQ